MGDFKAILFDSKVNDPANFAQRRSDEFANWVFEQDLIFEGPILTWRRGNHEKTFKGARIDRALGDGDWRIRFQDAIVKHFPMMHSDHSPLLLNTQGRNAHTRPHVFRFQVAWLTDKWLTKVVQKSWS